MKTKTKEWSVHELAACSQCSWQSEARDAKAKARAHCVKTGHATSGERGLFFKFTRTERATQEDL